MRREYYSASIQQFLTDSADRILGTLLINDEFETTDLQKRAWQQKILILKSQLSFLRHGDIAFEYTIPRIGHRVDVVLIASGIIFLLEFKVGDSEYRKATADQVMDYALDLKYFHEASKGRLIIPIGVSTDAPARPCSIEVMNDRISKVVFCSKTNLGPFIYDTIQQNADEELSMETWLRVCF